jgi:release factor glutamine methyltransferase
MPGFRSREHLNADLTATLRAAGCVFAEDEARLLLEAARDPGHLTSLVRQRVDGLPLEHLLGWAEFRGLRIAVAPGVFVPRRRTEFLAHQAIALVPPAAVVVELCCGAGAISAAIHAQARLAELHAVDIDATAVHCARRNLPDAHVHQGDLYAPLPAALRGRVDVLVANAPYVPTGDMQLMPPEARLHEPRTALDGGSDGLDIQRRVLANAPQWLAPGGAVLIETSQPQAQPLTDTAVHSGLSARVSRCEEHDATVLIANRTRGSVHAST